MIPVWQLIWKGDPVEIDGSRWPLERVLDTVGAVLACTVVARAIGGLMSALGVQSFNLNPGATSGSGVVTRTDFGIPTYMRLYYGTSWADLISGLTLLAAVAVIVLPRIVWDVPGNGRWSNLAARLNAGIGIVAAVTAVSASIGTVNWIWHASRMAGPAEAINVAEGVSAVALAVLCALLCGIALPYLAAADPDTQPAHSEQRHPRSD